MDGLKYWLLYFLRNWTVPSLNHKLESLVVILPQVTEIEILGGKVEVEILVQILPQVTEIEILGEKVEGESLVVICHKLQKLRF